MKQVISLDSFVTAFSLDSGRYLSLLALPLTLELEHAETSHMEGLLKCQVLVSAPSIVPDVVDLDGSPRVCISNQFLEQCCHSRDHPSRPLSGTFLSLNVPLDTVHYMIQNSMAPHSCFPDLSFMFSLHLVLGLAHLGGISSSHPDTCEGPFSSVSLFVIVRYR